MVPVNLSVSSLPRILFRLSLPLPPPLVPWIRWSQPEATPSSSMDPDTLQEIIALQLRLDNIHQRTVSRWGGVGKERVGNDLWQGDTHHTQRLSPPSRPPSLLSSPAPRPLLPWTRLPRSQTQTSRRLRLLSMTGTCPPLVAGTRPFPFSLETWPTCP